MTDPLSASLRFRVAPDLLARFEAVTPNVSERLRYLMERDLKEKARKRRPEPKGGVVVLRPGHVTGMPKP